MKTFFLFLSAVLVVQALRLLKQSEWLPFEAANDNFDNFALHTDELLDDLLK